MSTKPYQKPERVIAFLMVLTMLLGFLLMFAMGRINWLKTNPVMVIRHEGISSESVLDTVAGTLDDLVDAIKEFQNEYALANQPVPLERTPQEIYTDYVYEICGEIYPDVNPMYVEAIIWHESRFQADVVNPRSGTTGLMQVSPKWHTARANALGVSDLTDPYGNILVGCDILHELTEKYSFDYALDFFAGGYAYANTYKGRMSPFVRELREIIETEQLGRGLYISGGE